MAGGTTLRLGVDLVDREDSPSCLRAQFFHIFLLDPPPTDVCDQ